jgi:hypothetical protein
MCVLCILYIQSIKSTSRWTFNLNTYFTKMYGTMNIKFLLFLYGFCMGVF